MAFLALLGVAWSMRDYDGSEFLGIRQWREKEKAVEDQERFHISPMHRFVRHPWYSLSLVLIWTRDMDLAFLVTAVVLTLYFIVGARLEEQKLIVYHGERYRRYREMVPALLPLPWRYLSCEQANELQEG
jgi:protein-S-isoprenylcysteine O-methyltransferase Ste14